MRDQRELSRRRREDKRFKHYTRHVVEPFLDATDMRTGVECLYGYAAGAALGFTPRGLSYRAGLAPALHDARREPSYLAPAIEKK